MNNAFTRRDFLGATAAAGAGLAALRSAQAAPSPAGKSVVVRSTRKDATKDLQPDARVIAEMVDAVVMKLSGEADRASAWARYVKPTDVVAIKVNCLFGVGACTHPEVTTAVVNGCLAAGVPADNLIVWDRADKHFLKSGYEINRGKGVKYLGVEKDWDDETVAIHTHTDRLAKVLSRQCTALINVPILKSHRIAGLTMSMKNHYGSFAQPWKAHENGCDPFIAHLNALPAIREKTRLIVCDALCPVAEGGPQARPEHTYEQQAIMAATDTVAIDLVGLKMLDARREKVGLDSLEKTGKVKNLFTAAERGLGAADLNQIDLVEI